MEKLKIPYVFMGKEYYDRSLLRQALMENWDLGAAALKRGAFSRYFDKMASVDFENLFEWVALLPTCEALTNQMWDENYHEDVVFAKFLHFLDPDYTEVPDIPRDEKSVGSISKEELKEKWASVPSIIQAYQDKCGEKESLHPYDDKSYEYFMLLHAHQGKLLHTYIDELLASGY